MAPMTLPFLEKLLQVLAQGGFTSTYKYAVLLGLIDLCLEAGSPPAFVTSTQLARRVIELYWPQVRNFGAIQQVLRQNNQGQAVIVQLVSAYRQAHPDLVSAPDLRSSSPADLRLLHREVEWVLVKWPLPRVQRVGGGEELFIYDIGWGEQVGRGDFNRTQIDGGGGCFDNRIRFRPGAAESLVALSSVLRPLVEQQWLVMVRALNGLPEAELEGFLFGAPRVALGALHGPLHALQGGRCFYCGDALSRGRSEVDHFLPWSRYADDGLDNLLLAHDRCNRSKLHFLADLEFGRRWQARSWEQSDPLDAIAAAHRWSRDRRRTFGVGASVYQGLPDGVRLWRGGNDLRRLGELDLGAVHAFGRGLLADVEPAGEQ